MLSRGNATSLGTQGEPSARPSGGLISAEAGTVNPVDETFREYERVVDPKYLDEIRVQAKEFSNKRLSRQARLA